jgi:hypothetical protein
VNHGEDQDEEDVEVVFIGAKNPWHTFVVDLRRFAFEEPNIKHEMMIKNSRLFVSLLYFINVVVQVIWFYVIANMFYSNESSKQT